MNKFRFKQDNLYKKSGTLDLIMENCLQFSLGFESSIFSFVFNKENFGNLPLDK